MPLRLGLGGGAFTFVGEIFRLGRIGSDTVGAGRTDLSALGDGGAARNTYVRKFHFSLSPCCCSYIPKRDIIIIPKWYTLVKGFSAKFTIRL